MNQSSILFFTAFFILFACAPKAVRQKNKAIREYTKAAKKITDIEKEYPELIRKEIKEKFTEPEEIDSSGPVAMDTTRFDSLLQEFVKKEMEIQDLRKNGSLNPEGELAKYREMYVAQRELLKKIRKGAWTKTTFPLRYLGLINLDVTFDPDKPNQLSYKGDIRHRVIKETKFIPPKEKTFWENLKDNIFLYLLIIFLFILLILKK